MTRIKHYGLIGKELNYSFSKRFFNEKFENLKLKNRTYTNFEFADEEELAYFLLDTVYQLEGFNVTIPYKEKILPYLDKLHDSAQEIKAVNTVLVKNNDLIGYNTDVLGFLESIKQQIKPHHTDALILGTGGASKAVAFALQRLEIAVSFVSRKSNKKNKTYSYEQLSKGVVEKHLVIVNCTPVGSFPNTNQCPEFPYKYITKSHLVYDLIYNPKETLFLKKAKKNNANVINGLKMLELQAEKSWEIWNMS